MLRKKILFPILILALGFTAQSCMRDYVTGKRTFSLMSESQEIALGASADPQIVSEYGIYDDPALSTYLDSIGQSLARISHRPNLKYTFRVVDSPVVNAFALPGGWIYFTRGILAHFNSEAELAGVMGHELGHVVARHGAEQQSKAQLAQIGFGVGSVISEDFRQLSGLAQTGLGLLFLKFGRGHESESDRLGVEYSTKVGYNAHEMAGFFRTIGRLSAGSGQSIPTFLSTHPDPGQREARVHELTTEWQSKVPYKPKNLDRRDYLRRIDGIVYGEDPRQGFTEGNMFYHPDLRFQFPFPKGWTLVNTTQKVDIMNTEKNAGVQFSLAKGNSLQQAANDFVTSSQGTLQRNQNVYVHGMNAIRLITQVPNGQNNLHVLSYFIQRGQSIYVFHGFTSTNLFGKFLGDFEMVMKGFDRLTKKSALNKRPQRLRIERSSRSGTLKTILQRFGIKKEMLNELAILNGMKLEDQIRRGDYVKVVK